MKKFLFLLALMPAMTAKSQTTVYHPFPDSAAMWNIESYQWCGAGFGNWQHLYSIVMTGDTILNGTTYHKLEVPVEVIVSTGMCPPVGSWTIPGHYAGSIRQDTSLKKVFIIPSADSTEQLLYDFTMNVGDTVQGYLQSFAFPFDVVQSMDSVLVGTDYRKRWNINPCYGIYFIEGIGSTYGVVEKSPGCITDMSSFTITCFKQDSNTLYPALAGNCNLISGISLIDSDDIPINIYPNPFHDHAVLELIPKFEDAELKIFNLLGIMVRKQEFIHQKYVTLNRENLENGVYIIQLTNKKKQQVHKKLIIN